MVEVLVVAFGVALILALFAGAWRGVISQSLAVDRDRDALDALTVAVAVLDADRARVWSGPMPVPVVTDRAIELGPFDTADGAVHHLWQRRGAHWQWSRQVAGAGAVTTRVLVEDLQLTVSVPGEVRAAPVRETWPRVPLHPVWIDIGVGIGVGSGVDSGAVEAFWRVGDRTTSARVLLRLGDRAWVAAPPAGDGAAELSLETVRAPVRLQLRSTRTAFVQVDL